jgi:cytochrome c biogenesis protein CcmG, thiol:disulfide interchange protein DsbE
MIDRSFKIADIRYSLARKSFLIYLNRSMGMQHSGLKSLIQTLVLGATLFSSVACRALDLGKPAPRLEGTLLNRHHFDLAKEKGHWVIVTFWASWCPYCLDELPILNRYYKKHKKEGLRVLAISIDDKDDEDEAKRVIHRYSIPSALGREFNYQDYGPIERTPTNVIIDPNGIIVKSGSKNQPLFLDQQTLTKIVTPLLSSNKKDTHTPHLKHKA